MEEIFKNYFLNKNGEIFSQKSGQFVKLKTQKSRYERIVLYVDGKQKNFSVHRLMAKTFIPNPENKETVNHIDGNKLNNNVNNLEWATQAENQLHADLIGLNKVKGIDNGTFKHWFYIKDNKKTIVIRETIKDFCDSLNQSSNYSNVKKWCRKNHTLNRGFFKGYTFGYVK